MLARRIVWFILAILVFVPACDEDVTGSQSPGVPASNVVLVETSMGRFAIELYPDQAPVTVDNFLNYVSEGFYDSLAFHRVISSFVIQGGGFTADMEERPPHDPIINEADNGLKNLRGAVAMVRYSDPQSARSQFFINVVDNPFLDHRDDTTAGFGYAVFGRVVSGMDVVDAISSVPTGTRNGFNDVPVVPVVILTVARTRLFWR